jgi:hypothetical protein
LLAEVHHSTRLEKMVKKKNQILIILITSLLALNTWAVSNEEIEAFEKDCPSETSIEDQTCLQRYEEISAFVDENQELATNSAEANACASPDTQGPLIGINGLADDLDEVSTKLSCTEEDANYVQDHCGKQMACNMGRSVIRIVDNVAPSFITSRVERSLGSVLADEENSQCLDGDQPDCVSEVYRAFISSILSTFNSLRDVGRAAVGAFSNMKDYLFAKSDDLHTAAVTSRSEASQFMDSPGKYIISKLKSFKTGIDTWIKSQVFCQKWDESPDSGEKSCVEPLQGYACLDCNDGINAFCAGAGFFISEGLLTMVTAGTFTGLGLAARVATTGVTGASLRGARLLSAKVPALARLTNRGTKTARTTTNRASLLARTSNTFSRAKENVMRFGKYLSDSRVGRITGAATDIVMAPIRVVDNMSTRAMHGVLIGASRVGGTNAVSRLVRQTARQDFRALRMASRGADVGGSGGSFATRSLIGARIVRATNRRRGATKARRSVEESGRTNGSATTPEYNPANVHTGHQDSHIESTGDPRDTPSGGPDQDRSANQRRDERGQDADQRQRDRDEDSDRSERAEGRQLSLADASVVRATRLAVIADLAAKGVNGLNAGDVTAEAISDQTVQDALEGTEQAAIDPNSSLKEQLTERTGANFQTEDQAQGFVQDMRQVYQDPNNKDAIVERLMREKRLTREQASKVYESESGFYGNLADTNIDKVTPYSEEVKEVDSLLARISKLKEGIAKDDSPINSEVVASPTAAPINQQSPQVEEDFRRTPTASPTRTPNSSVSSPLPTSGGRSIAQSGFSSADSGGVSNDEAVTDDESFTSEAPASDAIADATEEVVGPPAPVEIIKEENPVQRQASLNRLASMEFLSLLLIELEGGKELPFRSPTPEELALVTPVIPTLSATIELSSLQVTTLESRGERYFLFKDFKNKKTIVVNAQGSHLSNIPPDLI